MRPFRILVGTVSGLFVGLGNEWHPFYGLGLVMFCWYIDLQFDRLSHK